MKVATPALDQLTARVTSRAAQGISEQLFTKVAASGEESLTPPIAHTRIQEVDISAELVLQLFSACRIRGHDYIAEREYRMKHTARELGLSELMVESVFKALAGLAAFIGEITSEELRQSDDAIIGAVLIDLFHIGYDDFDPDLAANQLDYNADDLLPEGSETPHNHLSDLIVDAVAARIIKRDGRELILSWLLTCGSSS